MCLLGAAVFAVTCALCVKTTDELHFIALGDWGVTRPNKTTAMQKRQHMVARAMGLWARSVGGLDFVVTTGDNFYPRGVESMDSERFKLTWSDVYNGSSLQGVPWFIANGNHDYHRLREPTMDNEFHSVRHSVIENKWIFPNLWHSMLFRAGRSLVHLIIIDSSALFARLHDPSSQRAWLLRELATSIAHWKILVAHHPIYCVGTMGPVIRASHKELLPLIHQWGVDVYISGHDHALQHFRNVTLNVTDFIVSGAGGKETYRLDKQHVATLAKQGIETKFFSSDNGFVGFVLQDDEMFVNYINHEARMTYRFNRVKRNFW